MPASRLLEAAGFNQLARGRDGYFLYNRNDQYIGRALEKYGEFSALEMAVLKQLCGRGDVVIEVGANIGAHTVGLARHVGEQGRILAFEPQRLVFQVLCANIALNSLTQVDCYWAALGRQHGRLLVPELDPGRTQNFGGLSLLGAEQGFEVDLFTLDRYIGLPRLRLVKLDVEGMEAEVLQGGLELLAKFKPLLYLENDRLERSQALIELVAAQGYRLFWHLPPLFNPENFYGDSENLYPGIVSVNMLCIHGSENVTLNGFTEVTDATFHPLRR